MEVVEHVNVPDVGDTLTVGAVMFWVMIELDEAVHPFAAVPITV